MTYVETALWAVIAWGSLHFVYQMSPHPIKKAYQQDSNMVSEAKA